MIEATTEANATEAIAKGVGGTAAQERPQR